MPDVAIALSGGVDSSVAAALLVESGRDVVGVTMRFRIGEIAGRPCPGDEESAMAGRVCDALGIPHVVVDLADAFREQVVDPYCNAYVAGRTPNPCIRCNERIKFGALIEHVRELGFRTLATGHYARLVRDAPGVWLERAADREKDQSYFLYRVPPDTLEMVEFPLGDLTKHEVRRLAAERGLPSTERRESQEVCFTDDRVALIARSAIRATEPGPIELADGTVIGAHRGIARYTVGQRKGLGIGGPGGPYRIVRIVPDRNVLVVSSAADELLTTLVTLEEPVWRLGAESAPVLARIRYRSVPRTATATYTHSGLEVRFHRPIEPLAPGQSVVLYAGDRVVGGGIVPAE